VQRSMRKLIVMARFAHELAALSVCKRLACGAIVFPKDFSAVHSIGYNGPARKLPHSFCSGIKQDCGCAHAEQNAINKLDSQAIKDATLYCTTAPCWRCATAIVNSGAIDLVYWSNFYSDDRGLQILELAGVTHWRLVIGDESYVEAYESKKGLVFQPGGLINESKASK